MLSRLLIGQEVFVCWVLIGQEGATLIGPSPPITKFYLIVLEGLPRLIINYIFYESYDQLFSDFHCFGGQGIFEGGEFFLQGRKCFFGGGQKTANGAFKQQCAVLCLEH